MIRLLILTAILAFAHARVPKECRGVVINNIKHQKELLQSLDSPYHLALDYNTDTLFFSYSDNTDEEIFKSAYLNLKTNELSLVEGISGGFANAVDSKNNIVYLGSSEGLYKFNYDTKKAVKVEGTDINIWQLFYKDDLYFTTYPENEAYLFKDGEAKRIPELADTKVVIIGLDNDKNIYYSNSSGLFFHEVSEGHTTTLGNYSLNGMSADKDGNLFFSTIDGLFRIKNDKTVENIAKIDYAYGVAVESDVTILYGSNIALIRLKPTNIHCDK